MRGKKDSPIEWTSWDENANVRITKIINAIKAVETADWSSTVPITDSVDDDVPYLDHLLAVLYPMSAKLAKIELKNGEIYQVGRKSCDPRNSVFLIRGCGSFPRRISLSKTDQSLLTRGSLEIAAGTVCLSKEKGYPKNLTRLLRAGCRSRWVSKVHSVTVSSTGMPWTMRG